MDIRYRNRLRALFSPAERQVFGKLNSPKKIQDYLDSLKMNFRRGRGTFIASPREVLESKQAYCIEGAILAATSLAYHGERPLLMDLQSVDADDDHVVALFKRNGLWGAISKTNYAVLRWRDPIYKSVRELAMSYFHEYFLYEGNKSMLAYSKPFDLSKYAPETFAIAQRDLDWLAIDLDRSMHFPVAPKKMLRETRKVSKIERKILDLHEWQAPLRNKKK